MKYPSFFDDIPTITLYDPLAGFLGSTVDGLIEYRYLDAVKLTGHSCPTVASAYWMTRMALRGLYKYGMPSRGGVRVEFPQPRTEGVTGVVASVVQLLTGAAGDDGFKGLAGIFFRCNLMQFGVNGDFNIRFIHREEMRRADVSVDFSRISRTRELTELMKRCVEGLSTNEENLRFAELWQDRVRRLLLDHGEDSEVFKLVLSR